MLSGRTRETGKFSRRTHLNAMRCISFHFDIFLKYKHVWYKGWISYRDCPRTHFHVYEQKITYQHEMLRRSRFSGRKSAGSENGLYIHVTCSDRSV